MNNTKKITFKYLNQLKLMIKPPERIVQLAGAFITLLGGTTASIPYQVKLDWVSLKHSLRNPIEILEVVNNQSTFLKRVRQDNLDKSITILTGIIDNSADDMFDPLYECVIQLQKAAKPLFKFSMNKKSRSISQGQLQKQPSVKQYKQYSQQKPKQLSIKTQPTTQFKTISNSPSSRNSSLDLSKRIQQAQEKKRSRLDKILKLSVSKPKAQSTVKSTLYGPKSHNNSVRSTSKESIIRSEIENNCKEIKKLRHQENEIKWQIERESKSMQKSQLKLSKQDDIKRYKEHYDYQQVVKRESRQQLQKSKMNVVNRYPKSSQRETHENSIDQLQSDYLHSSKQKMELEQSIKKILQNINGNGLHVQHPKTAYNKHKYSKDSII